MSTVLLDDDDYVTIGTPFEVPDDDEPLPKPSKVQDQIVTDKQGRRRLHGAFTGGFSAGYFNTVGSKEGWAPSTFKSSRSKKNNGKDDESNGSRPSKPEDFMDEEDFSEYGIAPKKLKTSSSYGSKDAELESKKRNFLKAVDKGHIHSAIPGGIPLDDLVGTRDYSMGIKLLKKLGWKPGQGVGEKVELPEEEVEIIPKRKVYGCAMPPKSKVETVDAQTFIAMLAPKDMQPISFERKDNLHGIGYYSLLGHPSSGRANPAKEFRPNSGKKGIRGHAFGIGVFEDDEEYDVYGDSEFSRHDMTMCKDDNPKDGWTGTTSKPEIYKDTLTGFVKSLKQLHIAVTSTKIPVEIPKEVPRHVFPEDVEKKKVGEENARSKLSSHERSELLGEVTKKWDKKEGSVATSSEVSEAKKASCAVMSTACTEQESDETKSILVGQNTVDIEKKTSSSAKSVFQPFAKDPEKQSRYNDFLKNKKSKNSLNDDSPTGMTEWEKAQEIAEFARAAVLYQPLRSAMADRFVSANRTEPETKPDGDTSSDVKAAELGMFGKLTRTTLEWHPDSILCKRMNIPDPYPRSSFKGVPSRGNKHTSIFSDDFVGNMRALASSDTRQNVESRSNVDPSVTDNKDKKLPGKHEKTEEGEDDDDHDDEFIARLQRNKGKLRGKVGPLSHLNIKKGDAAECKGADSLSTTTSLSQSAAISAGDTKPKTSRPAMDIFKAVFENSDSDDSDDAEVNEKVKIEEEPPANDFLPVPPSASAPTAEFECKGDETKHIVIEKRDPAVQVKIEGEEQNLRLQQQHLQQEYNKDLNQKLSTLSNNNADCSSSSGSMCAYGSKTVNRKEERRLPLSFLNKKAENSNTCSPAHKMTMKTEDNRKIETSSTCTYGPKPLPEFQRECEARIQPDRNSIRNRTDNHSCSNSSRDQKTNYESDGHRKTKNTNRKKEKKSKKSKKHEYKRDGGSDTDSDENYREKKKHRTNMKSKKKKKRKHSNRHSSSSSSSSSDDEDSGTPSNAELLEKLKKFVTPITEIKNDSRSSNSTAMSGSDTDSDENYREKRKHRTNMKSKKKRKRKHSNRHSSSSSSSSSDDEDLGTPSNAELLQKLKKFVTPKTEIKNVSRSSNSTAMSSSTYKTIGSRPTAADFM